MSTNIIVDVTRYMTGVGFVTACGLGTYAAPVCAITNADPVRLTFHFYVPNVSGEIVQIRYAIVGFL